MSSLKTPRKKKTGRSVDKDESSAARARAALDPSPPPLKLISQREVCERIGVTAPTIWEWTRKGRFPKARVLNGRGKLGYIEREIEEWILSQPLQRLKPADEEAGRSK
jgi:predicted DNA-binding transcriptional regulator AlpA